MKEIKIDKRQLTQILDLFCDYIYVDETYVKILDRMDDNREIVGITINYLIDEELQIKNYKDGTNFNSLLGNMMKFLSMQAITIEQKIQELGFDVGKDSGGYYLILNEGQNK